MTNPRPITLDSDGFERLRVSIEHWERMATGSPHPGEYPSARDCALCARWLFDDCGFRADRCPVYQATGRRACERSPYLAAFHAAEDFGLRSAQFIRAAKTELTFLRDLLARAKEKP